MKKFQEKMDEIEVKSYKDCVWYVKHLDKCKMCDAHEVNLPCHCKEEMDDFCTWVTKFFEVSQADNKEIKAEDEAIAEKYMSSSEYDENALYKLIMNALQ